MVLRQASFRFHTLHHVMYLTRGCATSASCARNARYFGLSSAKYSWRATSCEEINATGIMLCSAYHPSGGHGLSIKPFRPAKTTRGFPFTNSSLLHWLQCLVL